MRNISMQQMLTIVFLTFVFFVCSQNYVKLLHYLLFLEIFLLLFPVLALLKVLIIFTLEKKN